ncbi:MAG: acyltransferase [Bordetella sp. SCN 67-23]|nr:MAG: acyltransferase [Bordetella sp. SCN 67-23]OJW91871.1 MAG: acyltransferase [Burkholderiales bacterium 67-32]
MSTISPFACAAPPASSRRWELDALRGLMLVLMTSTHLPTWFSIPAGQPFGFVSAAEGFVFLSAYMAGLVYTQRAVRDGIPAMRRAFLRRALVIYACQAACLLFLFTVIAALGMKFHQPAANNLMSFYLHAPLTGLWTGLLMIYNPPLLDILPVYIVFMLASPWILSHVLQGGWKTVIWASIALWGAAQFGLSRVLYDGLVAATGLPVPFRETGSFETFAWQLLWVLGLCLGAYHARVPSDRRVVFQPWLVKAAVGIAIVFFVWRHMTGLEPFAQGDPLNLWFDKWHVGPLRLLDFLALVVVLLHCGGWLTRHLPRMRLLETLGAASLPVFCAHLVIVLVALAVVGESHPGRPPWFDPLMFGLSIAAMYAVARLVRMFGSGPGAGRGRRPAEAGRASGTGPTLSVGTGPG